MGEMGKVPTMQTQKNPVLGTPLGKDPTTPTRPTLLFFKKNHLESPVSSDHDLHSLLRVTDAQISQALLSFRTLLLLSLRRPCGLSRCPTRKMSAC